MPIWLQWILGAAALVAAIGVLWQKVIKPGAAFITTVEQLLPLAKQLVEAFKNTPHAFEVLDEIIAEFRTNSGSSLKDQLDRIETDIKKQGENADHLKVGVEAQKQLAEDDRVKLNGLMVQLGVNATEMEKVLRRLGAIQADRANVATDLAASQERAGLS